MRRGHPRRGEERRRLGWEGHACWGGKRARVGAATLQTSDPCAMTRKCCNRPDLVAKCSSCHRIMFVANGCKISCCNKNLQPLLVWHCNS